MRQIIKSVIRKFIRKPLTNLINLVGLALSLTFVIILFIYCYSELTTDNFHKNGDNIYMYGLSDSRVYTPGILKEQIDKNIAGVESIVRIAGTWEAPVFQSENEEPITSDLIFADEDFFKLFTYKSDEGNLQTSLKDPMTVVITKTLSNKLFGKDPAVGRIIKLNNSKELTISAVIEEPDANSCLSFSALTSIATRKIVQSNEGEFKEWGWCNFQTFLLLEKGVDPDALEKSILTFVPAKNQNEFKDLKLNPFKKIYFLKFPLFDGDYLRNGDKRKVLILVLVAILILMIALVNFINISTSQWMEQIKQTGVMKVVGATRAIILRYIIGEACLLFLASLIIAIELVNAIIPFIRSYTGIHFNQKITNSPGFILISLASVFALSLIFSIVPALPTAHPLFILDLSIQIDQISWVTGLVTSFHNVLLFVSSISCFDH